jgi:hypothetical protein
MSTRSARSARLHVPEVGAPDKIRRVETAEAVMDKADDIGIIDDRATAIASIGTVTAVE